LKDYLFFEQPLYVKKKEHKKRTVLITVQKTSREFRGMDLDVFLTFPIKKYLNIKVMKI